MLFVKIFYPSAWIINIIIRGFLDSVLDSAAIVQVVLKIQVICTMDG